MATIPAFGLLEREVLRLAVRRHGLVLRRKVNRGPSLRTKQLASATIGQHPETPLVRFHSTATATFNDDYAPITNQTQNHEEDWKELLNARMNTNPWDRTVSSPHLPPLDYAPADYATRHVLQLLQELHIFGCFRSADRLTVERCNDCLQKLVNLDSHIVGRAQRGDAILQAMELIEGHAGRQPLAVADRKHFSYPTPNYDTYKLVLQLYSKTPSENSSLPERCWAIVERMNELYRVEAKLEMEPHAFHCNMVLFCWSECREWSRAALAAELFLKQMLPFPGRVDAASMVIMMRICGYNVPNDSEKARELGAQVAVRLWEATIESGDTDGLSFLDDLPSHFYSHFLQAIRALPPGPLRTAYFDKCFSRAIERGKVNVVVLQEFLMHANYVPLVAQKLGTTLLDSVRNLRPSEASHILIQEVPEAWKLSADHPQPRNE